MTGPPACDVIDRFDGPWRFLSNFEPAPVTFDGIVYPTVEHAYQAAKTLDEAERARIAAAETPGRAKRLGRTVTMRADWDAVKVAVMADLVAQKFIHPHLAAALAATRPARLAEGNTWGDRFWGVCDGEGRNELGRILEAVRAQLPS